MIEDLLDHFFVCDLSSGKVFWRVHNGTKCRAGNEAGTLRKDGRVIIKLKGHQIYRYHIIWYFSHGYLPKEQIDHIDRDRSNDSISNLREVSNEQNSWNKGLNKNNTSGCKGVYKNKNKNKFIAQITIKGKTCYLGSFETRKLASEVREFVETKYAESVLCNVLSKPVLQGG